MNLGVVAYANDPEAVWAAFRLSGYREIPPLILLFDN